MEGSKRERQWWGGGRRGTGWSGGRHRRSVGWIADRVGCAFFCFFSRRSRVLHLRRRRQLVAQTPARFLPPPPSPPLRRDERGGRRCCSCCLCVCGRRDGQRLAQEATRCHQCGARLCRCKCAATADVLGLREDGDRVEVRRAKRSEADNGRSSAPPQPAARSPQPRRAAHSQCQPPFACAAMADHGRSPDERTSGTAGLDWAELGWAGLIALRDWFSVRAVLCSFRLC